jgi:hypothetical protein
MSVFNFPGYLAYPRKSLGGELIGFNETTGQPLVAAAGMGSLGNADGIGSYSDMSMDAYKTFQHENWQHPGSQGWSSANVPGWGNNPNLQMFPRRGADGLGIMPVYMACAPYAVGALVVGALIGYLVKK